MEGVRRTREPAVIRRIGWRLMPFLLLMYVLAFLDRTNVGFAKAEFQLATGISDAAYAFGASIFFVGYALLEVPSNLMLVRFGARLWLARIMIVWGLISAGTFLVTTESGFYVLRALLGIAEAGFFPGIIFYLTCFYPQAYRARAMGLFYLGAPLSFIIGGPVSGLLLALDGTGGLAGWQWMFLVEGLAATVVGVAAYFYLSDSPERSAWLTSEEKSELVALKVADASPAPAEGHGIGAMLAALASRTTLYFAATYALVQMSVYGLIFFLPGQVAALVGAKTGPLVGVIFAIPWVFALIGTWLAPRWADRHARHHAVAAALLVGAGAGLVVSVLAGSAILAMAGLSLAAIGFIAAQPILWSIATARLAGAHAAAAIALVNSIGALGAFAAPNLRVLAETHVPLPGAGIYLLAGFALLAALLIAVERGRRAQ